VIGRGFSIIDIAYETPFTPDDLAALKNVWENCLLKLTTMLLKKMTSQFAGSARQQFVDRGETYKVALIGRQDQVCKRSCLYCHEEYMGHVWPCPSCANTRVLPSILN